MKKAIIRTILGLSILIYSGLVFADDNSLSLVGECKQFLQKLREGPLNVKMKISGQNLLDTGDVLNQELDFQIGVEINDKMKHCRKNYSYAYILINRGFKIYIQDHSYSGILNPNDTSLPDDNSALAGGKGSIEFKEVGSEEPFIEKHFHQADFSTYQPVLASMLKTIGFTGFESNVFYQSLSLDRVLISKSGKIDQMIGIGTTEDGKMYQLTIKEVFVDI